MCFNQYKAFAIFDIKNLEKEKTAIYGDGSIITIGEIRISSNLITNGKLGTNKAYPFKEFYLNGDGAITGCFNINYPGTFPDYQSRVGTTRRVGLSLQSNYKSANRYAIQSIVN